MDLPAPEILALLVAASFLAGFVDAVAGGGGMILLPALMLGLPADLPIPTLLGTNKFAAATGTSAAAFQFLHAGMVRWRQLAGPVATAMVGSALGAHLSYDLPTESLRPILVLLLAAMLTFTLLKPELGSGHTPRWHGWRQQVVASAIALGLGFYDGIFGPGTGSLLIFLFVGVLRFDFLRASALAKAANWGSNAAALALFLWRGSWVPWLAVFLAAGNLAGGRLGAKLAIDKGNRWVRWVFVGVVSALLVRLLWELAQS
jgi:uncharacterized membrane protein YfcA